MYFLSNDRNLEILLIRVFHTGTPLISSSHYLVRLKWSLQYVVTSDDDDMV